MTKAGMDAGEPPSARIDPRIAEFGVGAALEDPAGSFNASLAGNTRRAIDIHEDGPADAAAFKALARAAIAFNAAKAAKGKAK